MTTTAIGFLVLSALLIWGGLVVSVVVLRRDGRLVEELEELEAIEREEGEGPGHRRPADV